MARSQQPVGKSRLDAKKDWTGILIVEDEFFIALDLEATLNASGYRVVAMAPSGKAALDAAAAEPPDLALVDIKLHGNLDGIETACLLQRRHNVPVVFVSAHADPVTMARAQEANPAGYVVKPFNPMTLIAAIRAALA